MARYVTYALNHEWHSYDVFLSKSPGNGTVTKAIITFVFALLLGSLIGILVAHVSHNEICTKLDKTFADSLKKLIKEADIKARENLLAEIDADRMEQFHSHFINTSDSRQMAQDVKKWWLDFGLDTAEVFSYNQLDEEEYQETEITVQYSNGLVLFRNQNILKMENGARKKLPAGLVEGDLIFANFGQREDYQYILDNLTSLSLEGKIAVVKEGMLSLEEKVHQAVAVHISGLILYPKTHGNASIPTNLNEALPPEETPVTGIEHLGHMLEIPVLTLSHEQADVFTGHMGGYPVPDMWKKDAVAYVGPGFKGIWAGSHVHLNVKDMKNEDSKHFAVVGKIQGNVESDQIVMLHGHQEEINATKLYGPSVLMELARVFGEVKKSGWHPRRTLLFCLFNTDNGDEMDSVLERLGLQQQNMISVLNFNLNVYNTTSEQVYVSVYPMHRAALNAASEGTGLQPAMTSGFTACNHHLSKSKYVNSRHEIQLWYSDKIQDIEKLNLKKIATTLANFSWRFADSVLLPYNVSELTLEIQKNVNVAVDKYHSDMESTELLDEVEKITRKLVNMSLTFDGIHKMLDKTNPLVNRKVNEFLSFLQSMEIDPGNFTNTNICSRDNTSFKEYSLISDPPSLAGLDYLMLNYIKSRSNFEPIAGLWREIRQYLYQVKNNLLGIQSVLNEMLSLEDL